MHLKAGWAIRPLWAGVICGTAFAQQVAFTSRTDVHCPVAIVSIESSKEFGFDAVMLRNDGPAAIRAVRFRVMFRVAGGDEIADERRADAMLQPHQVKRLLVGLGHLIDIQQTAKSHNEKSALAILTIESVEFEDGSEWKGSEHEGEPLDPLSPTGPKKILPAAPPNK